jgi:hypothetical protein
MIEDKQPKTPHTTSDETKSAFVEKWGNILSNTKSFGDELTSAYKTDSEEFQEKLGDAIEDVAIQDPDFASTLTRLRAIRVAGGDAPKLVAQLNEVRARIKEVIVSELGLPDEARFSEIEKARNAVAIIIEHAQGHPSTPKEILIALDIRHPGEDDTPDTYSFPYDHMPKSVIDKWETYLAAVCNHIQTSDEVQTKGHQAVMDADRTRKFAHNAVTDDVHAILGLQGKEGWNWESTRKLLAEMLKTEYPTFESGLTPEAREYVKTHTNPILIADHLSKRLTH